jgi:hypothetical protein
VLPFLSGIVIHFKGEAAVAWSETETRTKPSTPTATTGNEGTTAGAATTGSIQNVTVNYSSQEQYFENKFNLLGGGSKYYIVCNYCVLSAQSAYSKFSELSV